MTMNVCTIAGVFFEFQPLQEGGAKRQLQKSGTRFFGTIVSGENMFVSADEPIDLIVDGVMYDAKGGVSNVHEWRWKGRETTFTKKNQTTGEEMHFRFVDKVMNTWHGEWVGSRGNGLFTCHVNDANNQIPPDFLEQRYYMRTMSKERQE